MTKKKGRKTVAATAGKRSTRKSPQRPARPISHDDPIVADNAAVEIDFKHPPQDLDKGRLWARSHSGFLELKPSFDEQDQPPQPVERFSKLVFTYSKPNNPAADELLIFTTTENGGVVVSVEIDQLKTKSKNQKHLLIPAKLKRLRLRSVDGFAPSSHGGTPAPFKIDLFEKDAPKYNRAKFTIVAVRHPH